MLREIRKEVFPELVEVVGFVEVLLFKAGERVRAVNVLEMKREVRLPDLEGDLELVDLLDKELIKHHSFEVAMVPQFVPELLA